MKTNLYDEVTYHGQASLERLELAKPIRLFRSN
jgi:hypothetical protein